MDAFLQQPNTWLGHLKLCNSPNQFPENLRDMENQFVNLLMFRRNAKVYRHKK